MEGLYDGIFSGGHNIHNEQSFYKFLSSLFAFLSPRHPESQELISSQRTPCCFRSWFRSIDHNAIC